MIIVVCLGWWSCFVFCFPRRTNENTARSARFAAFSLVIVVVACEQADSVRDREQQYVTEFEILLSAARNRVLPPDVPLHFFLTPVLNRLAEIAEILEVRHGMFFFFCIFAFLHFCSSVFFFRFMYIFFFEMCFGSDWRATLSCARERQPVRLFESSR